VRVFRDGGDKCFPIYLQGFEEVADDGVESGPQKAGVRSVLMVRSRCCGREFCAACLTKNIVFMHLVVRIAETLSGAASKPPTPSSSSSEAPAARRLRFSLAPERGRPL